MIEKNPGYAGHVGQWHWSGCTTCTGLL